SNEGRSHYPHANGRGPNSAEPPQAYERCGVFGSREEYAGEEGSHQDTQHKDTQHKDPKHQDPDGGDTHHQNTDPRDNEYQGDAHQDNRREEDRADALDEDSLHHPRGEVAAGATNSSRTRAGHARQHRNPVRAARSSAAPPSYRTATRRRLRPYSPRRTPGNGRRADHTV